jgi:all-trans-nonaprenyl-diphosphate synthase
MALNPTSVAPHNPWLDQHLTEVRQSLLALAPAQTPLLASALAHATARPGKLLRPKMTLLCGHAVGCQATNALIEAAAVAEMIHVATLLHDDVLDDAELRRGLPTVKQTWGNEVAILAGDYLLAQASMKLSQIGHIRLVAIFSQVLASLCDGEINQLCNRYNTTLTLSQYLTKCEMKTGCLFAAAAEAAGVLANLPEERVQALAQFGMAFGVAFQLMDDRLDWTSNTQEAGKPVLSDLRNGLVTAPVLLAEDETVLPLVNALFAQLQNPTSEGGTDTDALIATLHARIINGQGLTQTQTVAQQKVTTALQTLTPWLTHTEPLQHLCQRMFP